jgi:serine/threonine protein kinase
VCNYAGTGTFGRVVLVHHASSKQYFALKMLSVQEVIKLKQVEHVKNEKDVLSSVRHPFIVNM